MAIRVNITFTNHNPDTIWNVLARKLGREPTNSEAKAEIDRILTDCLIQRAGAGKLPHQRKRK